MKQWTFVAMMLAVFAGCFGFCRAADVPAKTVVKIGVIVPLSGNQAFIGEDIRDGFLLAKEKIKSPYCDFEFVFEDSQFDLAKAALAAQKLVNVDHVNVLVTLWDAADVVAPIAEKNNVLHLSIRWDPGVAAKYPHTFTIECTYQKFIQSNLELLKKLGCKRVALIRFKVQSYDLCAAELHRLAESYGITIVSEQQFNSELRDFRTVIAKAKSENPDIYMVLAYSPQQEIIMKQLQEIAPHALATGQLETYQDLGLIEGQYYVHTVTATDEFKEMFRKKYGHDFKMRAPHPFDIYQLLVAACFKFEGMDRAIAELTRIKDFPGALGPLTVDADRAIESRPVWKRIVDGKQILVDPASVQPVK